MEEWSASASEVLERAVVEVPVKVLGGVLDVEEEVPEEVGEGRRGSRQAMAPRASLQDWMVGFGFGLWVASGVESGFRVTLWPWLQLLGSE